MCDVCPSAESEALALAVLEGSLTHGWDSEEHGGGLLYMMDIEGRPMVGDRCGGNRVSRPMVGVWREQSESRPVACGLPSAPAAVPGRLLPVRAQANPLPPW
jgi:hypothetical protein